MVKVEPLSDAQREALERLRRRAVGRVSQRAHMVLLSARGYSVLELTRFGGHLNTGDDTRARRGPHAEESRAIPGRVPVGGRPADPFRAA